MLLESCGSTSPKHADHHCGPWNSVKAAPTQGRSTLYTACSMNMTYHISSSHIVRYAFHVVRVLVLEYHQQMAMRPLPHAHLAPAAAASASAPSMAAAPWFQSPASLASSPVPAASVPVPNSSFRQQNPWAGLNQPTLGVPPKIRTQPAWPYATFGHASGSQSPLLSGTPILEQQAGQASKPVYDEVPNMNIQHQLSGNSVAPVAYRSNRLVTSGRWIAGQQHQPS